MGESKKLLNRYRVLISLASAHGQGYRPGQIATFPEDEAKRLVDAGFIEAVSVVGLTEACIRVMEEGGVIEAEPENAKLVEAVGKAAIAIEAGVTSKLTAFKAGDIGYDEDLCTFSSEIEAAVAAHKAKVAKTKKPPAKKTAAGSKK